MLYYYPVTGKGGLGNKLFPWARAVVFQYKNGGKIIKPDWENYLKIGPYIRNEKDKRHYFNIFNNNGYVKGIHKYFLIKTKKIILEKEIINNKPVVPFDNLIVKFQYLVGDGVPPYFESLLGYSILIKNELYKILNHKYLPDIHNAEPFIGVHIRLGDFKVPKDIDEIRQANALNYRLPLEWYINAIKQLRYQLGSNIKVKVFSDGTKKQLYNILLLNNIEFIEGNAAITDLLLLSKSKVIIASGSTFSMWAAFLEQKPSVWFTGLRRGNLIENDKQYVFQPEWESGNFSDNFIKQIKF